MVDDSSQPLLPRVPTIDDLKKICKALNDRGVRYMLVGGMALGFYGLARATHDIDFLVDANPEAVDKIKEALAEALPDKAALEVGREEIQSYTVVRVADEVIVDLMARIAEVNVETGRAILVDVDGITIPLADLDTLIATKGGLREKDAADRAFLLILKAEPRLLPPALRPADTD